MILRFFKFLFSLVLAVIVAGIGFAATYVTKWGRELPDYRTLDSFTFGAETKVFARDATTMGTLVPRIGDQAVSRTMVKLEEISPFMTASIIANEDRRFFEHYGLDPYGIARQFRRISQGEDVQGGSTLTNQLVRNTLLYDEYQLARTPDRKAKEWLLSLQVERSFTKSEILNTYLNAIYWGDGGPVEIYGIYSAAQAYFGKKPKDLTLAESAYLTVLVPSPKRRYENYELARSTMRALLDRMVEDKWITPQQREDAWAENLQPRGWAIQYDDKGNVAEAKLVNPKAKELKAVTTVLYPHFMHQVEQELISRVGRDKVYGAGGLRVYTTLDPKVQRAVETASREARGLPYGATLGAVILDPYSAEVLGIIGQKIVPGQPLSQWNNAAQGQRQIGSTIKPLLYTTALSTGLTQAHREDDRPISFRDVASPTGYYTPQNFEGKTTGRSMTIREALDRSLNLVTVRLADRIGLQTFFGKLRELGISPNDGTGMAAALGAVETTPVKMAAAYAPFVNGGLYRAPRYITRVTTSKGEVLYDAGNEPLKPKRVWTPQVAYLGLDMIRGVVNDLTEEQGGLAGRAKFGNWPVAGKTGTSNGPKDFWFVGTTPVYTGAVWVGKQKGGEMPIYYYSGYVNAPIWRRMMELAHQGKSPTPFVKPPGIYQAPANDPFLPNVTMSYLDSRYRDAANTALIADEETPAAPVYYEVDWQKPSDPRTVLLSIDRETGLEATEFTPPENVVQRRVYKYYLPGYGPEDNPKPLPDQTADPKLLKEIAGQGAPIRSAPQQP